MKMKKIVLLFSMIAVLFSLTACSDGQGEVGFDYTDTDITLSSVMLAYNLQNMDAANKAYIVAEGEEVYQTALSNFETTKEECGDFKGYLSKEDGSSIMVDLASIDTSNEEDVAELTQFLSLVDARVEEIGENVKVTLMAVYDKRNVELCFVYEEDPAYEYGGSNTPYKPNEITTTPDYTFGEKMGKAGANTLMGMGTVFIVLIFISLIIGQFEKVAKAITSVNTKLSSLWEKIKNRKNEKEETVTETVTTKEGVPVPAAVKASNPMEDAQLVAVITAAVVAANSSAGGSDKLVVRSIRKAKR